MARDAPIQGKDLRGFTLLEVLVSVAILAIIMAALYSAYTTNVEAIQIARENGQVHQTARIALDRMTKDLQSALTEIPSPAGSTRLGFIGKDQERDGQRMDRMDFTSLTCMAFSEENPAADLCEVGYRVVEDSEQQEILVLMRRQKMVVSLSGNGTGPGEEFGTGGTDQEVARNLAGFQITYEDGQGEEQNQWSSEESNTPGLPVLVKVRLVIRDALEREHVFFTTIHPELAGTINQ
jgi:prepilin-type N-terminal cleavage/methylation domain-containing protein